MVQNKGKSTQICYLDSCILTYIMNDKKLYDKIINDENIYAISQFNLYERGKNEKYYQKTLDLLSELPVVIFKHFEQMMGMEIKYYNLGKVPLMEMVLPFGILIGEQGRLGARAYVESQAFFNMAKQFDIEKEIILNSIQQSMSFR